MRVHLGVVGTCDWDAGFGVALGWLAAGAGERQEMGWGGGLILSKAQKSATAPAHPLLVNVLGLWSGYLGQMVDPVFMTGRQRQELFTTGSFRVIQLCDFGCRAAAVRCDPLCAHSGRPRLGKAVIELDAKKSESWRSWIWRNFRLSLMPR